ncbi:TPA: bifunctional phosphoglucose/phosphomannose isomerase [Candidatus Saccharibacteria bacterium]|nr:bifunctional phosphoglucose/phosphomannose isomerase [Candidatus Saccharibacteria bacterium]HIO87788.1 bifunctional phosphoglucose/phosphomannose isomerase [Candidatus Saccharibacteria bacterium]
MRMALSSANITSKYLKGDILVLDDIQKINQIDSEGALGVNAKVAELIRYSFNVTTNISADSVTNIVVGGMGGSNQPAILAKNWLQSRLSLPIEIVPGYDIPASVTKKTLFIASSYSGNTEESLSALEQAEEAGAQIVVMTSGGKLADIAAEKNYPVYMLTTGIQPRYALFNAVSAITHLLEDSGFVEGAVSELEAAGDNVQKAVENWLPEVETADNLAKQIAQKAVGNSVVIYGGPLLKSAAYRWKITINENAKNVAWYNEWPEFNHNEFIGWSVAPENKPYFVVELQSNLEHPRVNKRFEISNDLLAGNMPTPYIVDVVGDTQIEQLLWAIKLGDFASLYLAVLNGVDPNPVHLVEELKVQLKK